LPSLRKAVPGAQLANVAPFPDGLSSKPNQTFQADNLVVVNAHGGDLDRALKLQDWLSIQENYDLLNLGIEGTDWKAVGDDKFEALSRYSFPGYALAWRAPLYRRASYMTATEEKLFDWAQQPANFTLDPFSSFIPNSEPVKAQLAQMATVTTQFANPLFYGVVDVDAQLDKLKKAAAGAGLDKLQAEMQTQADAYLAKN
jgi:putative aldouronate transport system substrate-binding protein